MLPDGFLFLWFIWFPVAQGGAGAWHHLQFLSHSWNFICLTFSLSSFLLSFKAVSSLSLTGSLGSNTDGVSNVAGSAPDAEQGGSIRSSSVSSQTRRGMDVGGDLGQMPD